MRLFLAVDLDETLRQAASDAAQRMRRSLAGDTTRAIRWVEPGNLHATLHFLGEVAEDRVPSILDVLQPCLAAPGFEMGLGRAGVFPLRGAPRVIWIGISPGAPALGVVHRELAERLAAAGLAVDDRPLQAHVTIARVKEPVRDDLRALAASVDLTAAGVCRRESVTLYRSHLGPAGPAYEPQLRIPLNR